MPRSYGHVPDPDLLVHNDLINVPLVALPGLKTATPAAEISYATLLDKVPDQETTSSCVGNSLSTSIYLRAKILGLSLPRPSRKLFYDLSRLIDDPHRAMTDDGCRPSSAVFGAKDSGLVSEERWPLFGTTEQALELSGGKTDKWINVAPPQDVFEHALEARLGDYYRINNGTGCALNIRHALYSGFCPIFSMPVDESYENFAGDGVFAGVMGDVLGSHMQCVVGSGPGYLLVCNSWSEEWGNHGLVAIVDGWFNSGAVGDVLVPTLIPGGLS